MSTIRHNGMYVAAFCAEGAISNHPIRCEITTCALAADFSFGQIESFMAGDGIHCEILRRAAEVVGGEDKLAQHLDVRVDQMHEWIQGKANARGGLYLIALDVLSRAALGQKRSPERVQSCGLLISERWGALRDGETYETFE
jgi:hypothetical protein